MLRGVFHRAFLLLLLGSGLVIAGEAEWRAHLQAGETAHKRGDNGAATTSFDAALREAEAFGAQDRRLATTLSSVALHHQALGRLAEAESHYQRALAIREAIDGPDHADVASNLNSIAGVYYRQGRFGEAIPLLERAIAIWEKALGPDDLSVATGLHNLGQMYYRQGKYAEAEPLYQRALAIREKVYGLEHPSLMATVNNLALLYYRRGDFAQAESFSKRLLALREKTLGPEHQDVAKSLYELADVHRAQGRFVDAEPLYLRALQILKSKPSVPGQLDVATVQRRLDELRRMQGGSAETTRREQQTAKFPSQPTPEETAAAARIWERDRWHLTVQSANQARERGETMEAERLCFLAIQYVGERAVRSLDEYASLLGTLNRAGAQDARARAEKFRDARLRPGPGSVYLGFDPSSELRAYAALLRELARTVEADAVSALADAEKQVQFMNFIRNTMLQQGRDPRGTCLQQS